VSKWLKKVLTLKDIAQLYVEKRDQWLLLEIVASNPENQPTQFRLLAFSSDKDELHEYISEDDSWDWSKKYLMVMADPNKPCTIE